MRTSRGSIADGAGDQLLDGTIRTAVLGGRGDAQPPSIAVAARHGVAPGPRNYPKAQRDAACGVDAGSLRGTTGILVWRAWQLGLVRLDQMHRRRDDRAEAAAELALGVADAQGLAAHALAVGVGLADDLARTCLRVAQDRRGLATRVLAHRVRGPLGGDERLAQHLLELAVVAKLALELLDAVAQVGSLAPDLLERLGDVLELALDTAPAHAERAPREAQVAYLDRTQRHCVPFAPLLRFPAGTDGYGRKPSSTLITICSAASRAMMPTIGLRSSGPNIGRILRHTRMYGWIVSSRNPRNRESQRLYGSRK